MESLHFKIINWCRWFCIHFNKCFTNGLFNIIDDAEDLKLIVQDKIIQMGVVELEVVVKCSS